MRWPWHGGSRTKRRGARRRRFRWSRIPSVEPLEDRRLLAWADDAFDGAFDDALLSNEGQQPYPAVAPLTNPANPLDVNDDQRVSAQDLMLVVNWLNGARPAAFQPPGIAESPGPQPAAAASAAADAQPLSAAGAGIYPDVNGDAAVTPADALVLVNFLNGCVGDGTDPCAVTDPGRSGRHGRLCRDARRPDAGASRLPRVPGARQARRRRSPSIPRGTRWSSIPARMRPGI